MTCGTLDRLQSGNMSRGPKPGVGSRDFAPLFHDVHLHPQITPPRRYNPRVWCWAFVSDG
ncbi:protein of unknown function [Nitrospira defluvii]|uniref:Uncharacterized protein n=1 Tax=Nitrospira defluvii TaxID=330214 RepID=D8PIS4_9BACT|nr:protein of unknown function [Nitrospira defluvii]